MEAVILFTLFAVIVMNFILSVAILLRGIREMVNIIFGFFTLSLVLWSFGILGFYFIKLDNLRLWILLTHFSGALLAIIFLYFSLHFPRRLTNNIPFLFIPIIPFLLILDYLFYTDFIIGNVYGRMYEINAGYIFYSIYFIFYFLLSYIFLFIQYKKSEDIIQKKQIIYILGGSMFSSALATIVDIIFPYFNIFQYIWLGSVFTLIGNLSIAVAILKYRFLNIKVIATEFSVFAIWFLMSLRILIDSTLQEKLVDGILLIFLVLFGILLIRAVLKEIKNREQIEMLNVQLERSMEELKKLDELKTEFVGLASHQLRTPLTPIKGFSDMLLHGDLGPLVNEEQKSAVQTINISSQRMVDLIDDFLNISKLEKQGGFAYSFQLLHPQEIIEEIVKDFNLPAKEKGLQLAYTSQLSENTLLKIDSAKMKEAIGNIISNSIKYTKQGAIWIMLSEENGWVIISVKDTGAGINKEDIPHLFQKFFRGREISRLASEGTGLGLYFTRRVVEGHNGTIVARSEGPGKGSEFIIKLPK